MADDQDQTQHEHEQESKAEADSSTINVKVVTSTGDEVFFKIKKNTKMSKLKGAYAQRVGKDVQTIRFLYDGERLGEDETPSSLDMQDGDTIDVMVEQVGGGRL
ncbi:small ubiquitin-related modifier [Calocera viscosa TUFC12733]|uniref:Small ubiquitin-related modifier n=1 Tax=Calocera viscosa (strain TUFC12733) TaxID=1330018 RepID=A0A167N251_CALVF|nr:small ubiquitin-related modifier [Calocera viscosa TUFC12733]